MRYLNAYLQKIKDRGNVMLAESIEKTAENIGQKYLKKFSFCSHDIGLLLGNVQSGKTGQVFGIICKAAELGFPLFVLLTTDNVALQQQTLDRVKSDLNEFFICGENDSGIFIESCLVKPVIVVIKKNARVLRLWANVFNTTGFMKGNPLFIIDDEADAASLNTLVNRNRQSSINRYLDSIKNQALSSLYLQVTGTPQAICLQTIASGWHPSFIHYFQPGEEYLGGEFFFPAGGPPGCIVKLNTIQNNTRSVVLRHLAVSAQILASGGTVSNCLFHPSVRQAVHQKYSNDITREIKWCADNIDGAFIHKLEGHYKSCSPTNLDKLPFDAVFNEARRLLTDCGTNTIVMNGKTDVDSTEYSSGCNFIVGGNTLGRGITFPGLQTIYYTRSSKKPQADTMWQHSRMFGYDRDPGLMTVFIEPTLYKLFSDINATNNSLIAQIEQGIDDIKVCYPTGLAPTRPNVLDKDCVEAISGGTNYYADNPDNDTVASLTELLSSFSESEPYYQVNLHIIREALNHIIPSPDFQLSSFLSVIDSILSETTTRQGILIVRRGRDVTQGTGALLSQNDVQLGWNFKDKVVLTMYQVTGTKGWKAQPLWVPNIKLPHGMVYYDVIESNINP